jgi:hypothetical protein
VITDAANDVGQRLRSAAARLRGLGHPYDAAMVKVDLAQWLADVGDADGAAMAAATAAETFAALGA